MLNTQPLGPTFGVEVKDIDLTTISATHLYPEIRAAFEHHSALLFRGQELAGADFERVAALFGPIENRETMSAGHEVEFKIPVLSNKTKDGLLPEDSLRLMNLQANMLWHTDSTFLPVPALVNLLTARVVPSSGGETQIASTRAAWKDMPADMKNALEDAIIWHRLSHSRTKLSAELGALPMMTRWPDRPWRGVWPNPVTGEKAPYLASHAFAVEGMGPEDGQALIDEAIDFCTQDKYVYSHDWRVGDVLIWDERATLHRGQPWPYDEHRKLESICSSATDADGLTAVRVF